MDIHLGALRVDQHASGVVVEKKGKMKALVCDFYPFAAPAALLPLPGDCVEVITMDACDWSRHRVRAGCEAVDFDQAHGGAADFRSRRIEDQAFALQQAKPAVEEIHSGECADEGESRAVVSRVAK